MSIEVTEIYLTSLIGCGIRLLCHQDMSLALVICECCLLVLSHLEMSGMSPLMAHGVHWLGGGGCGYGSGRWADVEVTCVAGLLLHRSIRLF